jgi:hypothetical protein
MKLVHIIRVPYEKVESRTPHTYRELENEVNNFLNDFDENEIYDIIDMLNEAGVMIVHQAIDERRQ